MIESLMKFIGMNLPDAVVADNVMFVVMASVFLFAVAETFRLFEIVIDRLTRRRK